MAGQGYLHPQLGFAIVLPDAASLLEEADSRAVFAVAGEGSERPAIVTVELQAIEPGWDSQTFAAEALAAQAAVLGRLRVIDREVLQIDELDAARVVLQRRDDSGEVAVLDEWRIAQDGRGWIISAFCPIASYWALSSLINATAASFVAPAAARPAPRRAAFDAGSGVLTLSSGELSALTDLYEGRAAADEDAGRALARLEEARVVEGGRPAPEIEAMLAVVAAADVKLTVQRPEPDAMAWCHERRAALLLRLGADRRQLAAIERDRLPGVIADLIDLGPRPAAPGREPLRTTVAELAEAFTVEPRETPGALPGNAAELVAQRRGHWRIDAQMSEPPGHAVLEALDTAVGWWLVRPDGQDVTVEPTTASALWVHLTELAAPS